MNAHRSYRPLLALLLGLVACKAPLSTQTTDPHSGLATVTLQDLPAEGRTTWQLIERGGPFPYERDGTRFGNREGLLPKAQTGYLEYTVPTPGERTRGARRIVCENIQPVTTTCYYTADHYASFRRILP